MHGLESSQKWKDQALVLLKLKQRRDRLGQPADFPKTETFLQKISNMQLKNPNFPKQSEIFSSEGREERQGGAQNEAKIPPSAEENAKRHGQQQKTRKIETFYCPEPVSKAKGKERERHKEREREDGRSQRSDRSVFEMRVLGSPAISVPSISGGEGPNFARKNPSFLVKALSLSTTRGWCSVR